MLFVGKQTLKKDYRSRWQEENLMFRLGNENKKIINIIMKNYTDYIYCHLLRNNVHGSLMFLHIL